MRTAGTGYLCIRCREVMTYGLCCDACLQAEIAGAVEREATRTHSPADADVLERDVSAACDAYLELHGWTVYRIGISEAGRVYQTPGVPDRLAIHERQSRAVWIEYKRPHGGVQSEAQREFQRLARVVGLEYLIVTSVQDLEAISEAA